MRHFISIGLFLLSIFWLEPAHAGLLDSPARHRGDISPFTKWTGMLSRYAANTVSGLESCPKSRLMLCPSREWRKFLQSLSEQDLETQLNAINTRINFSYYITDIRNWGVADYWATPIEFLAKDGDCEDYAIAKYLALKALGLPPEKMRIVIVDDLNLGVPHAVLTVETPRATLVLDNQTRSLVDAGAVNHYRPIYAINETGWWLYTPR